MSTIESHVVSTCIIEMHLPGHRVKKCLPAVYLLSLDSQSITSCLKSRYVYLKGMRAHPLFTTKNSEVPSLNITLQPHRGLSYCTSFAYKLVISLFQYQPSHNFNFRLTPGPYETVTPSPRLMSVFAFNQKH